MRRINESEEANKALEGSVRDLQRANNALKLTNKVIADEKNKSIQVRVPESVNNFCMTSN